MLVETGAYALVRPPNRKGSQAFAAAERARHAISATPFPQVGAITMSVGICGLTAAIDIDEL